jgi:hypothetical protein
VAAIMGGLSGGFVLFALLNTAPREPDPPPTEYPYGINPLDIDTVTHD